MASIRPGRYSIRDIFGAAGFNFEEKAAADYNNGAPDFRRVKVGGLGFGDLEDSITVPPTADELVISVDGKDDVVLDIELSEEDEKLRAYSFETAADADDPRS